jgi:hypothetical protein
LFGSISVIFTVVLAALSFACWSLYKARNRALSDATSAREELSRTVAEREQQRAELTIAKEHLTRAASTESELSRRVFERDEAMKQIAALQRAAAVQMNSFATLSSRELATLDEELAQKRQVLVELQREIGALDAEAELQSFGLYRNHYAFQESADYQAQLQEVRDQQAAMLRAKTAAVFSRQWAVDGSVQKGQQMAARLVKLMLRAFNGECDAAIAKVRFNNVVALEERIRSTFVAVNKLTETQHCALAEAYAELKIAELHLAYEHALKLYEEREEQRRLREQEREEEVVRREGEQRQREAEREEELKARALEQARRELASANASERDVFIARVSDLEAQLAEAQAKTLRAISNAQLTRAGHVYVISNEGSFGSNVYKIGLSRREDPRDRVRELGGASVPFAFDIHAMIRSEDAPALESKLHRRLASARVNLVNTGKEFFAVTMAEIEAAVRDCHGGTIEFTRLAVAEDWRRTLALRAARPANTNANETSPASRVEPMRTEAEPLTRAAKADGAS